jgi:signal transduction histidine kinase
VDLSVNSVVGGFLTCKESNYVVSTLFGFISLGIILNMFMNYKAIGGGVIVYRGIFFLGIVASAAILYYLKRIKLTTVLIVIVYTILIGYICILPLLLKLQGFSFYSYFLELQFLTLIFGLLLAVGVKPYHDLIIGAYNLVIATICLLFIKEFKVETYLFYSGIVAFKGIISYVIFVNVVALRIKMKSKSETIIDQNKQLLELTNFRKDIIKVIAHDLRNPIQQISSLLDLLAYSKTDSERDEIMGFVNKSVGNAYDMLEELLKWAMQNDSALKDFVKINLEEVITNLENQLKEQLIQKKLTIVQRNSAGANILYSKNVIESVTRNLLINAIKYSPIKNEILVSCEVHKTHFTLTVFNTAKNVKVENIEKFNAGKSQLKSAKGTANELGSGNGLFVCRQMLNKNNGELTLEVVENGVLATVTINTIL